MREIVFIRHSQSMVMPEQPAGSWPLTWEGRTRCVPLADELAAYNLQRIITSDEVKAIETGRIIAGIRQIPWETAHGLHEHEYQGPYLSREAFLAGVTRLFAEPDQPVFGQPAYVALVRFQEAINDIMTRYPAENLGIVTHGRVLSLFLATQTGEPAINIWKALKMPDYRVLPET